MTVYAADAKRPSYREQRQQIRRRESFEGFEVKREVDHDEEFRRVRSAEVYSHRTEPRKDSHRSLVPNDQDDSSQGRRHRADPTWKNECERVKGKHHSSRELIHEEKISHSHGDRVKEGRSRSRSVIEFGNGFEADNDGEDRSGKLKPPSLDFMRAQSSHESHHAECQEPKIRRAHSEEVMETPQPKSSGSAKPERAVKYTFNQDTEEWEGKRVHVRLSERPFAQGGCRVCYRMTELRADGSTSQSVAKMYKVAAAPETYFDEAMTQMLAEDYAKEFNQLGLKRSISFLPVSVVKLSERGGQLVNVEPLLAGKYVKHNDNDGHVDTDDMVPQAFSHFSWEKSKRKLLICDIQGVGDFYTDPQIHSEDGEGFGTGNMGMEGVTRFFETHKCNLICKALQLRNCRFTASPEGAVSRGSSSEGFGRVASMASSTSSAGPGDAEEEDSSGRRARGDKGSGLKAKLWGTGRNYGKALLKAVKSTLAPTTPSSPSGRSVASDSSRVQFPRTPSSAASSAASGTFSRAESSAEPSRLPSEAKPPAYRARRASVS